MKNFEVIKELGSGGFATVYLVKNKKDNKLYALKKLNKELIKDQKAIKRFIREAEIGKKLNHPNIVKIYNVFKEDDEIYILMEYVEGNTLAELMKNNTNKFSYDFIRKFIILVCDALSYANKIGIIAHRDLKPQNIMITKSGDIKIMDFGIAKTIGSSITTSTLIFTPKYASPEQIKGENVDIRSDIYSLGIIVYEMIAGKPPFIANTPVEYMYKHLNFEIPSIEKIINDIPNDLKEFINKSLKKNPNERFKKPEDIISLLSKSYKSTISETNVISRGKYTQKPTIPIYYKKLNKYFYFLILILLSIFIISFLLISNNNKTLQKGSQNYEDWVTIGGNFSHDQKIKINYNDIKLLWKEEFNDEIWASIPISENKLYIVTYKGKVYSLDINSRKIVWKLNIDLPFPIYSSPIIMDNLLIVPANDTIVAISKYNGEVYWKHKTENIITSPPIFYKGLIYCFSHDGNMYIIDRLGKLVKKIFLNNDYVSFVYPTIYNNYLIFGSVFGKIFCFEISKPDSPKLIWEIKKGEIITSSATIIDDNIFIGCDNKLLKLDLTTGETIKEIYLNKLNNDFRISGTPLKYENHLIITTNTNEIYCLDSNEHIKWKTKLPEPMYKEEKAGNIGIVTCPLIINKNIFITSSNGKFYRIDILTGEIKKEFDIFIGKPIFSSPSYSNGKIFFGTILGYLYCFSLE